MSEGSSSAQSSGFTVDQRLALYNAIIVSIGALLAAIAWLPNFESKQEELSAFALLKDNPAGVLTVRDIGAVDARNHRYDVSFTLILKNTSNRDFDIIWSLDQLFVGAPDSSAAGPAPAVVNEPPDIWDPSPPGMLRWTELKYDLAFEDDLHDRAVGRFFSDREKNVTSPGGGLTGHFVPGHVSGHSAHYLVVAAPSNFVNVTITYGMNRPTTLWQRIKGNRPSSLYEGANLIGETIRLADAAEPGCRLGVAVQNAQITSACGASPL